MVERNDDMDIANQPEASDTIFANNDYYARAAAAHKAGDDVLAMHLYLSAYEQALASEDPLREAAAQKSLRKAWSLACELRERSIAEYVFDKLEPSLSAQETQDFARALQDIALDKLSEYGISRADLEDMADLISEELGANAEITGIAPIVSVCAGAAEPESDLAAAERRSEGADDAAGCAHDASEPDDAASNDEAAAADASPDEQPAASVPAAPKPRVQVIKTQVAAQKSKPAPRRMLYRDLVGFDAAIAEARANGLGIKNDPEYRYLIDTLRAQHGLEGLSAEGSVAFRSVARDDAATFMEAVAGELDLPTMRVQMQPGPQGVPILCVSVNADKQPRLANRGSFDGPGVIILEDFDLWGASLLDAASSVEGEGVMFMSMMRAAREALTMISSAAQNPEVHLLVSMGDTPDQGFVYDILEPMTIIDISLPTETDRSRIWNVIAMEHPSVRQLDLGRLVKASKNMSRMAIVTAAREAIEDAYRRSLRAMHFVPVTQDLMFEHMVNFQPLESAEYRMMEDAMVESFSSQLDGMLDPGNRFGLFGFGWE